MSRRTKSNDAGTVRFRVQHIIAGVETDISIFYVFRRAGMQNDASRDWDVTTKPQVVMMDNNERKVINS
jgi:hypothetical protein